MFRDTKNPIVAHLKATITIVALPVFPEFTGCHVRMVGNVLLTWQCQRIQDVEINELSEHHTTAQCFANKFAFENVIPFPFLELRSNSGKIAKKVKKFFVRRQIRPLRV